MKMSKVIMPLLVGTAVIGYVVRKGKIPVESSRAIAELAKVASNATINEEKSFAGLKQSEINEIALNTYKGIKAVIDGDTLEYSFASASGKTTSTARIALESAEELAFAFLSYSDAKSPRFFIDNLREAIKNKIN
ncbi:hypothetical protein ABG775_11200 [Peribacillus simplex]|uniref:hypothetical protein n=1 Tax=Peribacillus simplex TaxID=1478 RepID=UPI003395D1E0